MLAGRSSWELSGRKPQRKIKKSRTPSEAEGPAVSFSPHAKLIAKQKREGLHQPLPFFLNPVLETNPPRDLHVPRARSFRALQTGNRPKRGVINILIRHVIVPMVQGIRRLRPKLEL
jgi:hypothetical protein